MLRIALVSQEYPGPAKTGGIASQTYLKAHGLARRGHEVHVLTASPGRPAEYERGRVLIHTVGNFDDHLTIHTDSVRWLTHSAMVASALASLNDTHDLQLVDFPEWGGEGYVYYLNRTSWNQIPSIVHIHGPLVMLAHTIGWPEKDSDLYRIGTEMEESCLREADALLSSSECSSRWCETHYGIPKDRITKLHMGVDTSLFRPLYVPKDRRPTIVFVGKLVRNKGIEMLVGAACKLARRHQGLRLLLAGNAEPEIVRELESMVAGQGLNGLLEVLGIVPRDRLPNLLSQAHVFSAPSMYEGGPGLVYLEAMACGLPVVACSGSGSAEVIEEGSTGMLVPPENVDALTEALDGLLSDPQGANAMGARARDYVVSEASSEHAVERLEEIYTSVVG